MGRAAIEVLRWEDGREVREIMDENGVVLVEQPEPLTWLEKQTERLRRLATAKDEMEAALTDLKAAQARYESSLEGYQDALNAFDEALPVLYFEKDSGEEKFQLRGVVPAPAEQVEGSVDYLIQKYLGQLGVLSTKALAEKCAMSQTGMSSKLRKLERLNIVKQVNPGLWRLPLSNG